MSEIWLAPSSGRLKIVMTIDQARSASHQGQCEEDVRALSEAPEIAAQLASLDAETVASELRECGAWDDEELADHDQNLQRLLWIAAGDIAEENTTD